MKRHTKLLTLILLAIALTAAVWAWMSRPDLTDSQRHARELVLELREACWAEPTLLERCHRWLAAGRRPRHPGVIFSDLVALGGDAVDPLMPALLDERGHRLDQGWSSGLVPPPSSYMCSRALSRIGPPAVGALIEALQSDSEFHRVQAACTLCDMDVVPPEALGAIIEALDDPSGVVRMIAASTMGRIGPEARAAVPRLRTMLRADPHTFARESAAEALGRIGPAATGAVQELDNATREPGCYSGLRAAAAGALVRLGKSDRGCRVLIGMLASPNDNVRARAAFAMMNLGPTAQPLVPGLITLLEASEEDTRARAAWALGEIGPGAGSALEALRKATRDTSERVRDNATEAIGKIRTPESAPAPDETTED